MTDDKTQGQIIMQAVLEQEQSINKMIDISRMGFDEVRHIMDLFSGMLKECACSITSLELRLKILEEVMAEK